MWRKAAVCLVLLTACQAAAPAELPPPTATAVPAPTVPLASWKPTEPASAPGSDLVYLARAWEPKENIIAIEMPSGRVARRFDASSPYFFTVTTDDRTGYFATIASLGDRTRAAVERVDLRTGASTMQIDGGEGVYGNGLYNDPRHTAQVTVSADARTIALVRPGVAGDPSATEITLFDGEAGTRVATAVIPGKSGTTVDPVLWPAAPGYFALSRHYYTGCSGSCSASMGDDLVFLDDHLRQVTSPLPNDCLGIPRAVTGTSFLVAACGRPTTLRFFEGSSLTNAGHVQLPESIRYWTVGPNGVISLLSNTLVLYRVDALARRLIDARPIRLDAAGTRSPWSPAIAFGKTPPPDPAVQFSPDGRSLFAAPWDPLGTVLPADAVTIVDIGTGSVRGRFALGGTVRGLRLTPDGERLYVLVSEGVDQFPRWLYGLDARDGRPFARAELGGERVIRISSAATAP